MKRALALGFAAYQLCGAVAAGAIIIARPLDVALGVLGVGVIGGPGWCLYRLARLILRRL